MNSLAAPARMDRLRARFRLSAATAVLLEALLVNIVATPEQLCEALERAGSKSAQTGKLLDVLVCRLRHALDGVAHLNTTREVGTKGRRALSYSLDPVGHAALVKLVTSAPASSLPRPGIAIAFPSIPYEWRLTRWEAAVVAPLMDGGVAPLYALFTALKAAGSNATSAVLAGQHIRSARDKLARFGVELINVPRAGWRFSEASFAALPSQTLGAAR